MRNSALSAAWAPVMVSLALACAGCSRGAPSDKTLLDYARASSAFDSGDFAQARTMASKLRRQNPGFRPAAVLEAKSAWFSGDAKASASLFRALGGGKGDPVASLWLARALRSMNDQAGAKKAVESGLSADPDDFRLLRVAAQLAQDSGDDAAAKSYLDRAISSASELALAYLDRARTYWAAGDGGKATEDLKAAQALLPAGSSSRQVVERLMKTINETGAKPK